MLDDDEYPNAFMIKNNYKIEFFNAEKSGETYGNCMAKVSY